MTDSTEENRGAAGNRGAGGEGASQQRQVVVLLPSSDADSRWVRGRRLLVWVLVPLTLLGLGFYGIGELGWLGIVSQTGEAGAEGSEVQAASTQLTEATMRFRPVADSLDRALQRYAVRRSEFAVNRIGCAALAGDFREVDRQYVALSVIIREDGSRLSSEARDRYRELSDEVDEVNRHFDSRDCRIRQ